MSLYETFLDINVHISYDKLFLHISICFPVSMIPSQRKYCRNLYYEKSYNYETFLHIYFRISCIYITISDISLWVFPVSVIPSQRKFCRNNTFLHISSSISCIYNTLSLHKSICFVINVLTFGTCVLPPIIVLKFLVSALPSINVVTPGYLCSRL